MNSSFTLIVFDENQEAVLSYNGEKLLKVNMEKYEFEIKYILTNELRKRNFNFLQLFIPHDRETKEKMFCGFIAVSNEKIMYVKSDDLKFKKSKEGKVLCYVKVYAFYSLFGLSKYKGRNPKKEVSEIVKDNLDTTLNFIEVYLRLYRDYVLDYKDIVSNRNWRKFNKVEIFYKLLTTIKRSVEA